MCRRERSTPTTISPTTTTTTTTICGYWDTEIASACDSERVKASKVLDAPPMPNTNITECIWAFTGHGMTPLYRSTLLAGLKTWPIDLASQTAHHLDSDVSTERCRNKVSMSNQNIEVKSKGENGEVRMKCVRRARQCHSWHVGCVGRKVEYLWNARHTVGYRQSFQITRTAEYRHKNSQFPSINHVDLCQIDCGNQPHYSSTPRSHIFSHHNTTGYRHDGDILPVLIASHALPRLPNLANESSDFQSKSSTPFCQECQHPNERTEKKETEEIFRWVPSPAYPSYGFQGSAPVATALPAGEFDFFEKDRIAFLAGRIKRALRCIASMSLSFEFDNRIANSAGDSRTVLGS